MAVSRGAGLMQVTNRAFISRPYITEGDSYEEVKRHPGSLAIHGGHSDSLRAGHRH